MKLRRIRLSSALLLEILKTGAHNPAAYFIKQGLPNDCELISIHMGGRFYEIEATVRSDSFPELNEGEIIPELKILFECSKSA